MSRFANNTSFNRDYEGSGRNFGGGGGGDRFNNSNNGGRRFNCVTNGGGGFLANSGGNFSSRPAYDRQGSSFNASQDHAPRGMPNFRGRAIASSVGKPMHCQPVIEVPDCPKFSSDSNWDYCEPVNHTAKSSDGFSIEEPKYQETQFSNETWRTNAEWPPTENFAADGWQSSYTVEPVSEVCNAFPQENELLQTQENNVVKTAGWDAFSVERGVNDNVAKPQPVVAHEEANSWEPVQSKQSIIVEESLKENAQLIKIELAKESTEPQVNNLYKEVMKPPVVEAVVEAPVTVKAVSASLPVKEIVKSSTEEVSKSVVSEKPLNEVIKPTDPVQKVVAQADSASVNNLVTAVKSLEKRIAQMIEAEALKEERQKAKWQGTVDQLASAFAKLSDGFSELNGVFQGLRR